MTRRVFQFSWFVVLSFVAAVAPRQVSERQSLSRDQTTTTSVTVPPKYPIEDMHLMQPHYITLDDFESLLRRAGELFRPNTYLVDELTSTPLHQKAEIQTQPLVAAKGVATPYQLIQPPAVQPFNFYMPLFDYDHNRKLDAKSKRLEHIVPPPSPSKGGVQINYYATKSRKSPKKFNAGTKQVNMKWLNTFEKEALSDASGQLPKAVYLLHDERNRINFDDSFFGVDMQVQIPNNQHQNKEQVDGESGEEDLVAAAAGQVTDTVPKV